MKKASDEQRRRICGMCAKTFYVKPSKKGLFCSVSCKAEALRTRPKNDPRPCVVCGVLFMPHRGNGAARFCSKRCAWITTRGPEYNARISRDSAAARGDAQRDRGACKTYRKLGGRHEHRVVAEAMLGRPLIAGEVVHHKDGDRRNNSPHNLAVLTQASHMREHGLAIPGAPLLHKPWEKRRRK